VERLVACDGVIYESSAGEQFFCIVTQGFHPTVAASNYYALVASFLTFGRAIAQDSDHRVVNGIPNLTD
jgi:hypothetical protein